MAFKGRDVDCGSTSSLVDAVASAIIGMRDLSVSCVVSPVFMIMSLLLCGSNFMLCMGKDAEGGLVSGIVEDGSLLPFVCEPRRRVWSS